MTDPRTKVIPPVPACAPPATIVIFGAMGDLTRRLLMPALLNLARDGLIDPETAIIGIGRGAGSDADLVAQLAGLIQDTTGWDDLARRIHYQQGDFTDAATFADLAPKIRGNALFYLATAPEYFASIVEQLAAAGLVGEAAGFRRIVVEKPFGRDLASAQALNARLLACASEEQIYRIDHFLGKETVQNIMIARFGNALLEAVWNNRYIDHVQITAAELVGVGTRGKFYDATGALRDMVPNHLFQLAAMIAMEPPVRIDADAIRSEKSKVIAAVRPVRPDDAVRGRYDAGTIAGEAVPAYTASADVDPDGRTETFVGMKLAIDSWRWSGVPFYLRTGKAMTARDTEIVVQFRDAPIGLFCDNADQRPPPNRLTIQIQPDEGITLDFNAKVPGPETRLAPVQMRFVYADAFAMGHRTGYETLLYDVLTGDQTLFQRADQINDAWRAIDPLIAAWASGAPDPYPAGSVGPDAAAALLARDGRQWHAIG